MFHTKRVKNFLGDILLHFSGINCPTVMLHVPLWSPIIIASSPGPTPFWRAGKVSAVCVFTLGRTKKCAANQITVLKHVKLTCDSCSLRRVSTECTVVHGAMAMRDFSRVCDEPAFRISNCQNLAVAGSSQTRQKSLIAMAPWTTLHSVDTRRNEQLSHVSFTCFNTVIWLAAALFCAS